MVKLEVSPITIITTRLKFDPRHGEIICRLADFVFCQTESQNMFKAKLIDDPAYYKMRRMVFLIGLPSFALIGFLSGQWALPLPYFVGILALIGLLTAWRIRTHKRASSMVRNRSIEISTDAIRLLSGHGRILETFPVTELSGVTIKETWAMPEEKIQDLIRELRGNPLENYLIVHQPGQDDRRFDFVLDSYYTIEQLKKVVADWQARGLITETVS